MTAEGIRGGWRVKLYELENSGTWVDHGIGFAYIQLNSTFHGPALSVISESNPDQFLLQSKIQSEDLYEKQGETIILWKEADFSGNIDYALSFQEAEGCSFIWNAINEVQSEYMQQREYGSVPSFSRTQRVANSSSDHPSSSSSTGLNHDSNSASAFTVMDDVYNNSLYTILPTDFRAHESYLQQVKLKLESLHPSQRDYVAAQLLHEDCAYFKQLFRIFDELESKSQAKELVMLSEIFRFILLLNDPSIIEYLLSQDDVFRSVAGIFEYDKTLKERGQYRHFLFNTSQLREIIHLSEEVKVASKFLYRLKYVRDIMLHPTIDDPGITAINSMITFTSGEICSKVMNDESYMTELFSIIYPNVYQDLLLPQVQPALETSLLSPSSFEEANSRQKAPSKQPEGNTNQRFYQQLHQQQLDRLISFTPSSQGSRRRRKATIYSVEQLPDRFHGMLFLRELINLSKFMSYDRRVELYKSFFSKFKDVFMKVIMFVFHGATKALHYHIAPSPKPTNPLIIPSPTQVACSNSNITSPMNRQSSSDGLIEQKTVRSASSNTPLRQLSGLSSGNSKSSLNDENVNPDDSFEQETVKDNLTERQESCSQPSLSEEMEGVESSGEDQEWSAQLEWFCYEELYSHSQSLEALSHLADILSTIAFTFPSLIRQVILEGSHPPPSTAAPNASQSSKEKIERNGGQKTEDNRWIEKSLLFLLIDNIVNGKEITTIELFGETLKAVLDFDKQLNSVSLSANTTQGNGSNSLNPLHHQPHGQPSATMSNANAILLNQIKIEKEKFLPFFYDFYLTFLLAPYLDSNTPNQSIAPSFYENRGIFFVKQPAWSNKSLPAHSSPSNTGSGDLSSSQKPVRSVAFIRSSDPDNTSSSHSSSFFYETASKQSSFAIVTSRRLIIEVLTICILTHSYRIKYFLIKGNYVSKIISKSLPNQVERQQHKSVQLHAIKFLKCILMTRDDFYLRHFEKMDIFKPIIALLQVLPSKDNLVASSIYDVFEYIRNENMSLLIFYLVKKYGAVLDDLVIYPSVECFDKLKIKYLQLKEHEENPALFDEHQVNYRDSGGVNAELIKSATRERSSSSSSSSSSSLNSNSGVTRGRKRHLLAQQSSLTNRSAIRRMLETDDEEDYFDNDEDEEEVVPLEEDPDFFSAPKNDGEEARREMGKEVETDVRDKSIGPVPATKRIRVLSPTSQLSDETHNNSDDMSVSSSSSPRFLETLKYKNSFPSKPLSPPHYSQRKHGSPLDGETQSPTYRPHASSSPITSLHIMSSNPPSGLAVGHVVKGKSAASTSGTSDDVFSLLSIYNDHEDLSTEKESGEEGLRSSAGGEDNDERESLEAVAATSDHSSQDNKNDIDDDFLPLAPLKSKFDSEDDEEVVAAVFSFNSNSTSVRPSGIGSGVMGSSLNKPKISVSIKSAGQSKTSE